MAHTVWLESVRHLVPFIADPATPCRAALGSLLLPHPPCFTAVGISAPAAGPICTQPRPTAGSPSAPGRAAPRSQRAGVESQEEPGAQERGVLWVSPWGDPRPFHGAAMSTEDLPELSPWMQGSALAHQLPSLLTQPGPPTTRLKGGGFLLLFFFKNSLFIAIVIASPCYSCS